MKIGYKIYKPCENQEELNHYAEVAKWCNANNATIEDKGEYYEVVPIPAPSQEEVNVMEVERLKSELASTDYKCLKYVDGALSDEEYAEVRAYRAELRQRINKLQRAE